MFCLSNENIKALLIKLRTSYLHFVSFAVDSQRVNSGAELDRLVDDFYQWRIRVWPEYGTKFGINTYNRRIDDYTEEGFQLQLVLF